MKNDVVSRAIESQCFHTAYLSDETEACYGHTRVASLSLALLLDFPLCLLLYRRMIECLRVTHEFLQIEEMTYLYLGKYSSSVRNKSERLQYSFVTGRTTKLSKYNTVLEGKANYCLQTFPNSARTLLSKEIR